ncbi:gamma-glutamyltransferase family protein [Pseudorhodoplanes sp.]|uniref:gamma-glutamyltransferase family protein n=1 Tax=Pseudorhodoplanes sp. TaxID=1934341 RepID=UPI003D0EA307
MGTRHMAAACHYLAAEAGFKILEAGGNAIDAGVAAGITLSVVQPEYVNFAGVAPIILYIASENRVVTVSGLGAWPMAMQPDFFQKHHGGKIPKGILRTVVPAAPDAWISVLARWGTMSFSDVTNSAIGFARDGFPVYPLMSEVISAHQDDYCLFPSNAALYLPNGRPPLPGEIFVQTDLAATIQFMVDEEAAAGKRSGREAGLQAARDAFYRGDIADKIIAFQKEHGGLLTAEDLAGYRSGNEPPVKTSFDGIVLYSCGPWCQGPSLLQTLNLLDPVELRAAGHNTPGYLHLITEAVKLAFADREAYFGDPRVTDVPIDVLLSQDYASQRRSMIDRSRAWPEMPPPGNARPDTKRVQPNSAFVPESAWRAPELDTSYVCVVDRQGNVFSATPSDNSYTAPVVPGLGIIPSCRGSQSWADPNHVSGVAPGKRPRLTPSPAIAVKPGKMVMPFGTPGGDVQTQAMLQVFLNIHLFEMDVQEAVEAPRIASYGFPSSFEPHAYHPGRLNVESRIERPTGDALSRLGHEVEWWPEWTWLAGAVCAILANKDDGVLKGGADPRRPSYVLGL